MDAVIAVTLLWIAFAGTHIGLTTRRTRTVLVARLGERGFSIAFSVVASVAFAALVHVYALHRFDGPPGLALGASEPLREVLMGCIVAGFLLALGALWSYPASPYSISSHQTGPARGMERITRHPFFVGMALVATAHALLATRLVGTVFFVGLAFLSLAGAHHQDRKLLARRGAPFAAFLAVTSVVPFAAVLSGRQHLVLRELPWRVLAVAALVVVWVRWMHASLFAAGGAWIVAVVVGGAFLLIVQDLIATRRRARRAVSLPARPQHDAA